MKNQLQRFSDLPDGNRRFRSVWFTLLFCTILFLTGSYNSSSALFGGEQSPTQDKVAESQNTIEIVDRKKPAESKPQGTEGSTSSTNQKPADDSPTDTTENPEKNEPETSTDETVPVNPNAGFTMQQLTDRKNLPSTLQMIISFASISLVPAILLMTTCFIRIVVVLGILRQAIGLQQLPPTQVTTALALMMTFLVMSPTWKQVKENAIDPYSAEGSTMSWEEAWREGVLPIKKFMWRQIRAAENEADFWMFYDYLPEEERTSEPESFEEIPLKVMMPAFMISELKVAFLIGAQIILPFLIIDIVVASFTNTMGLMMMPPTLVSLPIKLALFVMMDGWRLVAGILLASFAPVT